MPSSILAHHIRQSPFLRLLPPLITGILVQWYIRLPVQLLYSIFLFFLASGGALFFLPMRFRFRFHVATGLFLYGVISMAGALLVWAQDRSSRPANMINASAAASVFTIRLEEPLSEKGASFKTVGSILQNSRADGLTGAHAKLLLYLQKDSNSKKLCYGDELLLLAKVQPVKNTGNPGSFDYARYCAFQGIHHQAYLKSSTWLLLCHKKRTSLQSALLQLRTALIRILHRYIPDQRDAGLAAALLIGFRDELDKDLVQSYANTGVVHIIAISGLHLGLIYWILLRLCSPLAKKKWGKWIGAIFILSGLWGFSLLSGASPSVLRSAVMFTCIVVGNNLNERSSIYNTLAASAFLLLCYNPFWLWDAGFQLSYLAVLSLVIFMKPVYNLVYIKQKLPDMIWKSLAVTMAAQILTLPLVIYSFHQLPLYVLLTNLVAVPLSSIVLCGELLLCVLAWAPALCIKIGLVVTWLIRCMNGFITMAEHLPFSTLGHMSINTIQTVCLFLSIATASYWLIEKHKPSLYTALSSLFIFFVLRSLDFDKAFHRRSLIVYNTPKHTAIDLVQGRTCTYLGDSSVLQQDALRRLYIQPSHTLYRLHDAPGPFIRSRPIFIVQHQIIVIVDSSTRMPAYPLTTPVDLLILTRHCRWRADKLLFYFKCKRLIADASCSLRQVRKWRSGCAALHIPFYAVGEEGAFVMNFLP